MRAFEIVLYSAVVVADWNGDNPLIDARLCHPRLALGIVSSATQSCRTASQPL